MRELAMTSGTIELVERIRHRLNQQDHPVSISGPAPETAIDAAEHALGCVFPPSYRAFLRTFGGISLPTHLGIVHDFVGVSPSKGAAAAATDVIAEDVVGRTLKAREERRLPEHLLIVGLGAEFQEWFCLDVSHQMANGEYPVLMYDARDNTIDQQFYDDFGQMLDQVMGFVADSLDQPMD
jgi:hypothetical protein